MMAIDFQAIFGGEEYDPCEALKALRPVYMQMIATGAAQKITFRDRETWFQQNDGKALGNLIAQLEGECAAKSGRGPRRFAIRAGSGRRPPGFDPFRV